MEIAKRYSIAYKGLKNGHHEFDFKVDEAFFEAMESVDIKGGECDVHVTMERSETMLELGFSIDGYAVCECDRCLEDCKVPIEFEGELLVKFSTEVREYDGEVMWLSPAEGEVPLAQYIYESIVLALPYSRVHADGECDPDMLARFTPASEVEAQAEEIEE